MKTHRLGATALAIGFAAIAGFSALALAQHVMIPREQPDRALDAKTRKAVIEEALRRLDERYVFPETAKKMADAVHARTRNGEYDKVTSSAAFADSLTAHLQAVSHDKHLRVRYSHEELPEQKEVGEPTPEQIAKMRADAERRNYGFEKVERMLGNVGYLELRGFMDPEGAAVAAEAAMRFLARTDALIIDLRRNGGGDPRTVALITSYLYPEGEKVHLNDLWERTTNRTEEFWTREVPGPRFGGKDVYVLTSRNTFSGAEEFSYNLKNLKRATIVGETTGGGAHPVRFERIDPHFTIGVPYARAINPISRTNWEGVGVEPDVKVPADEALKTAHLAILGKLRAAATDPERQQALADAIQMVESGEPQGGRQVIRVAR